MKTSHLSDHEIQRFIFDQSECDSEMITHIYSCEVCKIRTETYLSLSNIIKDQLDPALEFNLPNLVFDKLQSSLKKEAIYNYFIYFLITISVGIVASTLYLFSGFFIDHISNTKLILTFFMIDIALLITITLVIDLVRSFNKKIKMINIY